VVVSVTKFHAGDTINVIPGKSESAVTVRTLKQEIAAVAEERMRAVCAGLATASGDRIDVDYNPNYPVTFNHAEETDFAGHVAETAAAVGLVNRAMLPVIASEDFSYMLQSRPGAFIFIGKGDSACMHHPPYDFNDDVILHGMSHWVSLAKTAPKTLNPAGGKPNYTKPQHGFKLGRTIRRSSMS
jgi:metal-dependent amidase/aminoacylase/carboxypeptidase family protein